MLARLRPRITYSNVVATLALFIALGGTAWAVAANSVGTAQLKNDAVISSKVKDGSLTGADLNKAQLGPVGFAFQAGNAFKLGGNGPSAFLAANGKAVDATHADNAANATHAGSADSATNAATAANANAVGGLVVRKFDYNVAVPTSFAPLFTLEGLTVNAGCENGGTSGMRLRVYAATATDNAEIYSSGLNTAANNDTVDSNWSQPFNTTDSFTMVDRDTANGTPHFTDAYDTSTVGQTRYRSAGGQIVSVDWTAATGGGHEYCHFFGTAIAG